MDFMRQALEMGIVTHTTTYPHRNANEALADLRAGRFDGATVHIP
jgi:propanol-preferring alcohol dehydrogenase